MNRYEQHINATQKPIDTDRMDAHTAAMLFPEHASWIFNTSWYACGYPCYFRSPSPGQLTCVRTDLIEG